MSEVCKPKIPSNSETPWSTHDEKHVEQWGTIHKRINKTEGPPTWQQIPSNINSILYVEKVVVTHVVLASFHKINLLHEIISGMFTCSVCSCCITLTPKTNNCYFLVRDKAGTCKNVSTWVETCHYWDIITFVKSHRLLAQSKNCVRWVNNLKYRRQRLLTLPYMYDSRCGIPIVERPRNDVTYEKSWKCPQGKTRKSIHVLA